MYPGPRCSGLTAGTPSDFGTPEIAKPEAGSPVLGPQAARGCACTVHARPPAPSRAGAVRRLLPQHPAPLTRVLTPPPPRPRPPGSRRPPRGAPPPRPPRKPRPRPRRPPPSPQPPLASAAAVPADSRSPPGRSRPPRRPRPPRAPRSACMRPPAESSASEPLPRAKAPPEAAGRARAAVIRVRAGRGGDRRSDL